MQVNDQAHSPVDKGRDDKVPVYTFCKDERLCSSKLISALFDSGNIFYISLFKVVWMHSPSKLPFPAQVVFSVSKKGFRHAVSRNLARRRIREAYRKNKHLLYEHLQRADRQIIMTIILRGNTIPDYKSAEKSIIHMISKFREIIEIK